MNSQPNAHMNQKSAIQLVAESLEIKERFFGALSDLNERYDVVDTVFCCDKNGAAHVLETGYYGEVAEYDSITEAKQNCNIFLQGIRIHNDKFAVGNLYRNLSDVKEEVVIDLAKSVVL